MEKLKDYFLQEKINETRHSIVYRGKKENQTQTVIIKVLKTRYPSPSEIARFKQEYRLVRNLTMDGIIRTYDLVEHADTYAIIEEDFNGVSLKELVKSKKPDLNSYLQIAIKISETLGILHKNNIIHLDIKPDNILINTERGTVKITDFGISTTLTHSNDEIYNPDVIRGTLSYMSPEQTGRMNRTVDYRTDLYSFGITLYEMFTGEVPFKSTDPMELIHSHIARMPSPPKDMDPSIPAVISRIIIKLISKTPEERYQNGFGIMADLQQCLELINDKGEIADFEIGTKDISSKFIIPQMIYGREKECVSLMSCFDQASRGSCELMIVSGHPGIGKSALINEVYKPITAKRGYFITGKYEQFRKNVPYNAIIQAFQGLIDRILGEGGERINIWKTELLEALGGSGKYLTYAIPRLEHIIGKQPEIPELESDEMKNKFSVVFKNFINVFATAEHPLVIFLDDMQWADAASYALIRNLVTGSDVKYLMLIAAYRDNETDETHPFAKMLGKIKKEGININSITVGPLDLSIVNELIYNFFRCGAEESLPLAEIIYKKTNGNPFFVNQFFKSIYDEGMLEFDPGHGWKWNIEGINKMQVTDNVVQFMAEKITNLPADVQQILKICACIGSRFDLETLSLILDKSIEETLNGLTLAIDDGYVSLFGNIYKFHHDRIQEAAYSLLSDEGRASMHYIIGSYMLQKTKETELDDKIQYIVNQLNSGSNRISGKEEKYRLAELNLMAAKKAKRSGAFDSSLSYLQKGIEFISDSGWMERYDLALLLHTEAAVAAYRSNDHEKMERYSQAVLDNARNILDKERVYETKILAYSNLNKNEEAKDIGFEALRELGIRFPKNPGKIRLLLGYLSIKRLISEKNINDLFNIPPMTNRYTMMAMRILSRLTMSLMVVSEPLHVLSSFKRLKLSLKYGSTNEMDASYATCAAVLCGIFNDIDAGYRLCKTALSSSSNETTRKELLFYFHSMIRFRKEHIKKGHSTLLDLYQEFLQAGHVQIAGLCLIYYAYMFYTGIPLSELEHDFTLRQKELSTMKFLVGIIHHQIYRQQIQNLLGRSENPSRLAGEFFNTENILPILINAKAGILICIAYLHETIASYTFDDYRHALESTKLTEKYIETEATSKESIIYPFHIFYDSIVRLAVYPEMDRPERRKLLKKVIKNQKKIKTWAHHAPMNFLHKLYIVEAELYNVRGKSEAIDLYDKAINEALNNEYLQDAALACELAAKYWLKRGKVNFARNYLRDALRFYELWGSTEKVKDLKKKHPSLVQDIARQASGAGLPIDTTGTTGTQSLDLVTVIKTSQSLSTEIDLGKLLMNIMKLSIENAGAQHGFLILANEQDKNLYIEASGKIDEAVEVLKSIPVEGNDSLSVSIVNYVHKITENVVLNDATGDQRFINDPYIKTKKPKSILCAPIRYKGMTAGIIYLENNLATGVFTPERIELLQILSSQAAISIENSRLIAHRESAAKLQTEMNIAANIQSVLLPETPSIAGFDVTAYLKPTDEVGGDYYDVINRGNCDWVIIGDVSGHGVPAGLVMMMVQTTIQALVREYANLEPSRLLSIVNEAIKYNVNKMNDKKYMTITAFSFKSDGSAVYSGLHQDLCVYRKSSDSVEIIPSEGIWLSPWDMNQNTVSRELLLKQGDILLLYTDGITEAVDSHDEMFSQNKMIDLLKKHSSLTTDEIRDKILEALQGYSISDDITMVLMKKK
jgi:predicted ATPase/serine phosphatase RsbU (regulator of sigma subunit)/tRNA A-37 threonylcarbamoyl transferase component Bud32